MFFYCSVQLLYGFLHCLLSDKSTISSVLSVSFWNHLWNILFVFALDVLFFHQALVTVLSLFLLGLLWVENSNGTFMGSQREADKLAS